MRISPGLPVAAAPTSQDVDAHRTAVSVGEIRDALGRAYSRQTGRAPSAPLLDMLTAQASLETRHGAKMYNYNFGGIKGKSPEGTTAHYLTREVVNGKSEKMVQGFRAYASLDAGAADYLTLMRSHYGAAMGQAEQGNVEGFVHALKQSGYFTAPEAEYSGAIKSIVKSMGGVDTSARAGPIVAMTNTGTAAYDTIPTSDQVARVMDAISASAARIAAPIEDD